MELLKQLMKRTFSRAEDVIENANSGVSCIFVKLTRKWGAKMYWDKETRDVAVARQCIACEHGMGPEVLDSYDLPLDCVPLDFRYIYITEILPTGESVLERILEGMGRDFWEEKEDVECRVYDTFGWEWSDGHAGNIGYKDGDLVPIDFGPIIFRYNRWDAYKHYPPEEMPEGQNWRPRDWEDEEEYAKYEPGEFNRSDSTWIPT